MKIFVDKTQNNEPNYVSNDFIPALDLGIYPESFIAIALLMIKPLK